MNALIRHCRAIRAKALAAACVASLLGAVDAEAGATLEEGFLDPPVSARPGAFWNWLNGRVDRERLAHDLEQMKQKGMGGAEIWDVAAIRNGAMIPAGPAFLGDESVANIQHALAEGRRRGLRMGLITSSGWNAGGSWVDPGWASKTLISSSIAVEGGQAFDGVLPFPEFPQECPTAEDGRPLFFRDIAVLAVPGDGERHVADASDIVNLTELVQPDGSLRWDAPPGRWTILRFTCTNTGQKLIVPSPLSNGLFIDFLDPAATRRHLQHIMDRLGITPENAARSGLGYLEVDSMELHEGNPWTDDFAARFADARGYDVRPWLPVLAGWTVGDTEASSRFLYDYRKAVSDLLIESHYDAGSAFLAEYAMDFVGEAGGPGPPIWNTCPVDALKALGSVDVPRGEFWIQHRNMFLIKEVASAAHTYGKPVVDAESFTTWRRWQDPPAVLKVSADRAFGEGLNRLTIHGFAHSPDAAGLPGWTYHAGIDINPNTTWWPFARPFMDYLARCSFMLQQGRPVADVLWYYGDQAPNFFPAFHDVPEKPRLAGLGRGHDFDVVDSKVVLERLRVEDGRFVLPEGTSYAVLAFPEDAAMPLEVLRRIESLVAEGGAVVAEAPSGVPGIHQHEARQREFENVVARMWGGTGEADVHVVGNGRVRSGRTLDDALRDERVAPDFDVDDWESRPHIDWIHRSTGDREIYFVRNSGDRREDFAAWFRVSGRKAELWDPLTGETWSCEAAEAEGGGTSVALALDAGGSIFVVFGGDGKKPRRAVAGATSALAFTKPWTLSFPQGWGAPPELTLESLASWTESANPDIRHFSGIAEYRNEFDAVPGWTVDGWRAFLDLGEVHDVAEIALNGESIGVVWTPPHRVDVTDALVPGKNALVVRVANQWHNRLVGDSLAPPGMRFCRTNNPLPSGKDAELLVSGLLGPVSIVTGGK